jgi:hypothetical protein
VTFVRAHVHVHPATVLEVYAFDGSGPQKIADIPEKRDVYAAGEVLSFGTVNAARSFAKAMAGACVLGRITDVAEYNARRAARLAEIAAKGAP